MTDHEGGFGDSNRFHWRDILQWLYDYTDRQKFRVFLQDGRETGVKEVERMIEMRIKMKLRKTTKAILLI